MPRHSTGQPTLCEYRHAALPIAAAFTLAAQPAAAQYAQTYQPPSDVQAPAGVRVVEIQHLSDEDFLSALAAMQRAYPERAFSLALDAASYRPHLAEHINGLSVRAETSNTVATGVAGAFGLAGAAALAYSFMQGESDGGGGGGGGPSVSFTTVLPPTAPGWETDPADWDTAEHDADYSKSQINASAAYVRGGTGEGIKVGVIDGGVYAGHPEFNLRIGGCFDTATGLPSACNDPDEHGTHVAGVIGAARDGNVMHGVAFDSEIYSIRAFGSGASGSWVATPESYGRAIDWAISNGVQVINNSYSTPGDHTGIDPAVVYNSLSSPAFGDAFQKIVDNDMIMVWATGNDALDQPSAQAALPYYYSQLAHNWVAVTSSTPSGGVSGFANYCGVAAAWCVTAPGGDGVTNNIVSTIENGGYAIGAGTSMAAPQVTGAIAVLLQLFGPGTLSNLTPEQVVQVLFQTADKNLPNYSATLNSDGLSTWYGHGLIDLDAATTPDTFNASIETVSHSSFAVGGSHFVLRGALGSAIRSNLSGKQLAVFDELNRGLLIDLDAFASQTGSSFDIDRALTHFGRGKGFKRIESAPGTEFALRLTGAADDGEPGLGGAVQAKLSTEISETLSLEGGWNVDAGQMMGFFGAGTAVPEDMIDASAFGISYLGLAEDAATTGLQRRLAGGATLRVMAFGGTATDAETLELDEQLGIESETNWIYGAGAEWTTPLAPNVSLSLRGGTVAESDELLGSEFEGAFALKGATTAFAGVGIKIDLAPKLALLGSYDTGVSAVTAESGSLFSSFGAVVSDTFSLGLAGGDGLRKDDRYGLIVSQPMRVTAGQAELTLPQARNADGSLGYAVETAGLAPDGQELRFQGFYSAPLLAGDFSMGALLRLAPDHNSAADAEWAAMSSYRMQF